MAAGAHRCHRQTNNFCQTIEIDMKQTVRKDGLVSLEPAEGMILHDTRTDACSGGVTVPQSRVADFEEVPESDIPKYTEADYKAEVRQLIAERYSIEDELALQRQKDAKPEQYAEYDAFCEECKVKAKALLSSPET